MRYFFRIASLISHTFLYSSRFTFVYNANFFLLGYVSPVATACNEKRRKTSRWWRAVKGKKDECDARRNPEHSADSRESYRGLMRPRFTEPRLQELKDNWRGSSEWRMERDEPFICCRKTELALTRGQVHIDQGFTFLSSTNGMCLSETLERLRLHLPALLLG